MQLEFIRASYGAGEAEAKELLAYNQNKYNQVLDLSISQFPLPDENFVSAWEGYVDEANHKGGFPTLKSKLVQLNFPIQAGISQTEAYQAATRRGVPMEDEPTGNDFILQKPEKLELILQPTLAGQLPLLFTSQREDFVSLVQALAYKNEPRSVPGSMGAAIIAGYNNWDRIHAHRQQWVRQNPNHCSEEDWEAEFRRIIPQKKLYQDCFVILSDGAYSGVPAADLGLFEAEWRRKSFIIRREHECTHYFTRRVYSSMQNNLLDELIAEYAGIVAANGCYRADWFLRFVGLENFPFYREGGRLQNYRGNPPLSDGAFLILQIMVKRAAENLERFDLQNKDWVHSPAGQTRMIMALTYLNLVELASEKAEFLLYQALDLIDRREDLTRGDV